MELSAANMERNTVVIRPRNGLFQLDLISLWRYRELLYFLVWRDVLIRYKQTAIGICWAVLQPIVTMVIFTLVFSNMASIPSDGKPYPVFAFAALLPWNYFSQALQRSGSSLVSNSHLITKIYFPRLLIPVAASLAPAVDLFFSCIVLFALMLWYGIDPAWGLLALPFLAGLSMLSALAVGLWLTTLNVKYRDVGHIIPFLIQIWMYASPVAYPVSMVPEKWRLLYSLNPMVGVIEGFRWAILGSQRPDWMVMAGSATAVGLLLLGGLLFFKRMEETFADII